MKLSRIAAVTVGLALATQAGADVRPTAMSAVSGMAYSKNLVGARVGAPVQARKEHLAQGAIVGLVLGGGVIAGGVILATKDNGHSSSP